MGKKKDTKSIKMNLTTLIIVIGVMCLIVVGTVFICKNFWLNKDAKNLGTDTHTKMNTSENKQKIDFYDGEFYNIENAALEYINAQDIEETQEFEYDFDGDGTKDKITIKNNNNGQSYKAEINGQQFYEDYFNPSIYIVDLDEKDNRKELILCDSNSNTGDNYKVFLKQENSMIEIYQIIGKELKIDKNGKLIVDGKENTEISPSTYLTYYNYENDVILKKCIDVDKIRNVEFKSDSCYFSQVYSCQTEYNSNNLYEPDGEIVKKLDNSLSFNIIEIGQFKDSFDDIIYTFKVKLSDGREGYIFHMQLVD